MIGDCVGAAVGIHSSVPCYDTEARLQGPQVMFIHIYIYV